MNSQLAWPVGSYLAQGLITTLWISLLSVLLATALGVALAALSRSPRWWVAALVRFYVEIFRGVPSLMILLFVFFALPQLGLRTSPTMASVLGLGLWGAANVGEVARGALDSIPTRQEQGARALGMNRVQALLWVILPQAVRRFLPPYVGQLTVLIQASALTSIVGATDLLGSARQMIERLAYVGSGGSYAIVIYAVVLAVFFSICYPLSVLSGVLERKLRN